MSKNNKKLRAQLRNEVQVYALMERNYRAAGDDAMADFYRYEAQRISQKIQALYPAKPSKPITRRETYAKAIAWQVSHTYFGEPVVELF